MNDSTSQVSSSNIQCEYNELKTDTSNRKSCDYCRKRKSRCNSHVQQPCNQCKKAGVECTISKRKKSGVTSRTQLEKRICELESLLYGQNTNATKPSIPQDAMVTSSKISSAGRQAIDNSTALSKQQRRSKKIIYSSWMKKKNVLKQSGDIQPTLISDNDKTLLLTSTSMQSTIDMIREIPDLTPKLTENLIEKYI